MYDPTKPYNKKILEIIKKTWNTSYVFLEDGVIREKFSYYYGKCSHTDGIGTKGIYHWQCKSFENAVIDSLAMNLNDLAMSRATPYAITDHLLIPKEDRKAILKIISCLADECNKRKIAIAGGETAIHNDMSGLELSITMLGFVEKPKPNKLEKGDLLIGIGSNGLHSNGFTKIRELFEDCREEFIKPTLIYSDLVLFLNKNFNINGMMHITGGAFTKLRSLLDKETNIVIEENKLKPQKIFYEIYERGASVGVSDEEMYKTFNCGIGFVLGVNCKEAEKILSEINKFKSNNSRFKADIIGEVVKGNKKIKIYSQFSNKWIEL